MRKRGLTLAEILVSLFLIGIFGLVAVGSLNMALQHWGRMARKVNASQNARLVTSMIAGELRMAIPWSGGPNNGLAIWEPSSTTPTSQQLRFLEPTSSYGPMSGSWDQMSETNYRLVTYKVEGQNVVRVAQTFDSGYNLSPEDDGKEIICSASPEGSIQLDFTYQGSDLVDVQVTATEGSAPPTRYNTRCFAVGR
ncbi:MAG: type II secretion system protein [Candidatus Eremiobacterota bacterium]